MRGKSLWWITHGAGCYTPNAAARQPDPWLCSVVGSCRYARISITLQVLPQPIRCFISPFCRFLGRAVPGGWTWIKLARNGADLPGQNTGAGVVVLAADYDAARSDFGTRQFAAVLLIGPTGGRC